MGDGEEGLAGAGGAGAEDEFATIHGADVGVLHGRAGDDGLLARRDAGKLHATGAVEGREGQLRLLRLRHADRTLHVALRDIVAFEQPVVERFQHAPPERDLRRRTGERHHVAARTRVDAEPPLDEREVLVELAAERGSEAVVVEGEIDLLPLAARTALGEGPALILVGEAVRGAELSDRPRGRSECRPPAGSWRRAG